MTSSGQGLFAQEVEQLLNEREKNAEQFFKGENNEENKNEIEQSDVANPSQEGEETSNDCTKEPNDPTSIEADNKEDTGSFDKDTKETDIRDVSHDNSVLDTSKPLMLEEDSSDEDASEKDLENIFSQSVNKSEELPTSCTNDMKRNIESAIDPNPAQELGSKRSEEENNSKQSNKETCHQYDIERSNAEEENKLEYLAAESESLRLFLEPEDDASEDITNVETNETTKNGLNASTVSDNANKEGFPKSANRIDLPELKGALAKLGSPKLGKTAPKLSGQASDDFLTFEVDKDDYSSEDKGLSDLKNRFVKHIKCSRQKDTTLKASNKEPVQMTIVSKETDSRGTISILIILIFSSHLMKVINS